jgi:hypothetical protein
MKLYIHFGIYKGGSSYIQYICANQIDYLNSNSIYFPSSKEDQKMKKGLISKGNADGLDLALKNEDESQIGSILQQWYTEAKVKNCDGVLISAEALVHQLAQQKRLDLIKTAASAIGFKEIKTMGFFRDLADHALSTYKHRAKTGKIPDYKHWVGNVYETPELLHKLAQVIHSNQQIKWTLRKFSKDSDFLKKAFFKEWLGLEIPVFEEKLIVNESVTLSEIQLLIHLKKTYPSVIDIFVNDFKSIPKNNKARDKDLENYIFQIFIKILKQNLEPLEQINVFFHKNEKLILGELNKTFEYIPNMQFNNMQLVVLLNRIKFFNSFKGKKIIFRRFILRLLN